MKTKFNTTLTAAAAMATVLSLTAPAKAQTADDLIDALAPYMPTEDRMAIQTDNDIVEEFDLAGILNLNAGVENLEIAYLGEAAGRVNRLSFSSSNGLGGELWSDTAIRSERQLLDPYTGDGVGTFSEVDGLGTSSLLQVGTTANLGNFSAGDTLNFTLAHWRDSSDSVSLSENPSNFRAYRVDGFADWLVLGIEDNMTGGDGDFNDTVVALRLGENNITDVPEPATTIALFGVAAASLGLTRRKNAAK